MSERKVIVINPTVTTMTDASNNVIIAKKKVCAYARVSTNQEDQINSYNAQIREYEERIKNNPDWDFVKLYADEGLSGTSIKHRKSFLEMIEDAKLGKIDLILTKSLSRFSRNTIDSLTIIRELREINVDVFFEKENLYSSDPKVDFMLTIFSSIAQEESRNISENVKWGIRKRFQEGKVKINTKRFLGYEKNSDGDLIIVDEEAHLIRKIFNLYVAGKSYKEICDIFTERGYINATGKIAWTGSTIKNILENEKYMGDVILQKTVRLDYLSRKSVINDNIVPKYHIVNNHPAIVSKELFKLAELKRLSKSNTNTSTFKDKFPLSGIVVCSLCGRPMNRNYYNYKQPSQRIVLTCKNNYRNKESCSMKPIDNKTLELACTTALKELDLYDNSIIDKTLSIVKDSFDQTKTLNMIELLNDEIRDLEDEIVLLINEKVNDTEKSKDKYYNQLYLSKKEIIEDKETEIKLLEQNIIDTHQNKIRVDNLKSFLEKDDSTVTTVISTLIKKIIVKNPNEVTMFISKDDFINKNNEKYIKQSELLESIYNSKYIDPSTNREISYSIKQLDGDTNEG